MVEIFSFISFFTNIAVISIKQKIGLITSAFCLLRGPDTCSTEVLQMGIVSSELRAFGSSFIYQNT